MISTPTAMMISAMTIVVMRSILTRWFLSFLWLANFSLIMIRKPETESVRL